jgi:hypothetical protein
MEIEYVKSVAKEPFTIQEAIDFLDGLEDHNQTMIEVVYDIKENGFLVSKTKRFKTMEEVTKFIRTVQSLAKPIIKEIK